ncbi:MAG: hypothetical protein JXR96_30650 [Deltaproteobacteria bacterium]|nr:hypothetical protein [Deltaproteobacteria bacterium]
MIEPGIITAGALASAFAVCGVVLSLWKKKRGMSLAFGWGGLGICLLVLLAAWLACRQVLADFELAASVLDEIQSKCYAIVEASRPIGLALWACLGPVLLSVFLIVRGLGLPAAADRPAPALTLSVLSPLFAALGIGLLCASLLAYLDFYGFYAALLRWWV